MIKRGMVNNRNSGKKEREKGRGKERGRRGGRKRDMGPAVMECLD